MNSLLGGLAFTEHLERMTDDTGLLQHCKFSIPDRHHGYSADDNARALILSVLLYEETGSKEYLTLMSIYLAYLYHSQTKSGRFRNFMDYGHLFTEKVGSDDCFGRCIWAICRTAVSASIPESFRNICYEMILRAEKNIADLHYPRSVAYALIGYALLPKTAKREIMVSSMAKCLTGCFIRHVDEKWKWFENEMTYSNAVLPWALYSAASYTGSKDMFSVAGTSFEFLESLTIFPRYFKPIGCNGWLTKGDLPAEYDEQPLEACEMILALIARHDAYNMFEGGTDDLQKQCQLRMEKVYMWYHGTNSKGISLIDSQTGGCCDGITPTGLNLNQGAESIVSYGIATLAMAIFFRES